MSQHLPLPIHAWITCWEDEDEAIRQTRLADAWDWYNDPDNHPDDCDCETCMKADDDAT